VRFQLVIQFHADTVADLDALIRLEDNLSEHLGTSAEVDGHDIGTTERNIFVLTDSPVDTFEQVQPLLRTKGILGAATVAYRTVNGSHYTVLWPQLFTGEFRVA
jgi:hypothetical protein